MIDIQPLEKSSHGSYCLHLQWLMCGLVCTFWPAARSLHAGQPSRSIPRSKVTNGNHGRSTFQLARSRSISNCIRSLVTQKEQPDQLIVEIVQVLHPIRISHIGRHPVRNICCCYRDLRNTCFRLGPRTDELEYCFTKAYPAWVLSQVCAGGGKLHSQCLPCGIRWSSTSVC